MRIGWLLGVLVVVGCSGGGDCPADQLSCGGTCIDPLNTNAHCGTCDNACSNGNVCGNGACGDKCPLGQAECAGTCADTQTDAANCGACGAPCDAGDVCTDGICHVPCDPTMLSASIADPWGVVWDGLERPAAALDVATASCAAFGATLPTATELYRVSATQSGAVGQSFHTNFLWSRAPNDRLNQATVRLSDGTASAAAAASAQPYRCVCPAVKPRYFTGNHCNGPAADACYKFGNYNIDLADRPALRKSAAIAECVNERAHLVDLPVMFGAIRAGLPGSGQFNLTADSMRYDLGTLIKWSGATWEVDSNVSFAALESPAPFRCAGAAFASSVNATVVDGAFVPKLGTYKAESTDLAAASWATAHDYCWLHGGHLTRSTELAELIEEGLPGGSGNLLWTADQVGYNTVQFLAEVVHWAALDQRFPFAYPDSATWVYKTDPTHAYRCIYYPIDPSFTPPASCNGGCSVRSAGSPAATVWFDLQDRPAATLAAASATCGATGGYLASERDYTEAIRDGLANGSGQYLLTWDIAGGSGPAFNHTIVLWTAAEPGFSDLWNGTATASMTWSGVAAARPYRCMWTNEIR